MVSVVIRTEFARDRSGQWMCVKLGPGRFSLSEIALPSMSRFHRFLVAAVNRRHILRILRGDYALYSPETCVAQAELEQQQGFAVACRSSASAGAIAGEHGVSGF